MLAAWDFCSSEGTQAKLHGSFCARLVAFCWQLKQGSQDAKTAAFDADEHKSSMLLTGTESLHLAVLQP